MNHLFYKNLPDNLSVIRKQLTEYGRISLNVFHSFTSEYRSF